MTFELEILRDSYSTLGEKSCKIFDSQTKAFQFKDSGGLFGDKVNFSLSSDELYESTKYIFLTPQDHKKESAIIGKVTSHDGSVTFKGNTASKIFSTILDIYKPEQYDVIYVPAIISNSESANLLKKSTSLLNHAELLLIGAIAIDHDDKKPPHTPISISKNNNKITLKTIYGDTYDFLNEEFSATIKDNRILINKSIFIGGCKVNNLTLTFPDSEIALKYTDKINLCKKSPQENPQGESPSPKEQGITSKVTIDGTLNGVPITRSECNAELSKNNLTLRPQNGQISIVKFDFISPNLAIEGTSGSFLISNSNETIIRISAKDDGFLRAILSNEFVRSAAYRSANLGPFIANTIDGRPVRLEFDKNQINVSQDGDINTISTSEITPSTVNTSETPPTLKVGQNTISAQLSMLEGVSAEILNLTMKQHVQSDISSYLSTLIGLEGDYFTYNIFGPLAETHIAITNALAMPPSGDMSSLESTYEKNLFLAFMANSAPAIARALETTISYLPAFSIKMDEELLGEANIANKLNTRNIEQAYQHALGNTNPIISHLYKIESFASRLSSMRKSLSQQEGLSKLLPLGVSAAAAFISPLALVSVAQQGYSIYSHTESKNSLKEESLSDAFDNCSREWDYIIKNLLPSITHRVLQGIYQVRLSISATILSAHEKFNSEEQENLESLLIKRLARLKTFSQFPSSAESNISRYQVTKFLFELQENAQAFSLRHF